MFSFTKLLPNSIAQWVRAWTVSLKVMSSNSAGAFIFFTFQEIGKTFFVELGRIEKNTTPVKVFWLHSTGTCTFIKLISTGVLYHPNCLN